MNWTVRLKIWQWRFRPVLLLCKLTYENRQLILSQKPAFNLQFFFDLIDFDILVYLIIYEYEKIDIYENQAFPR